MILNYEVTVFKSILASFSFLQHAIFDDVNFISSFFLLLPMQHHAASQAVTPASPGPARTLKGGHPLQNQNQILKLGKSFQNVIKTKAIVDLHTILFNN